MAAVVGPVGLLVVLLVGSCAAEGKSLVRGVRGSELAGTCVCVDTGPHLLLGAPAEPLCSVNAAPAVSSVLRDSGINNNDGMKTQ